VRTIEKQPEPSCLANLRREAKRVARDTKKPAVGSDWAPRDCGGPIREALCREQHGLCAYCMRRIRPYGQGMKIERLIQGRRAVINQLRKRLRVADDVKTIQRLLQTARTPTSDGLPEYARVAIEYLQAKLRARAK